jgi:hypothetical protein
LNKSIDVIIDLVDCVIHQKLNPLVTQVYHDVYDNRYANQNYNNMAAHCKYLSEEAVEGDPSVDVDDGAKKDAHKLVVVWNKYEVLIRHGDARG